jgi:hypothetical protein
MARATMATLITRTRLLIGDPAGGSQVFTDDQVEDALDSHRVEVVQAPLRDILSFAPGGAAPWLEYFAPRGNWEEDEVLADTTYTAVTPTTSDRQIGRWTFAASKTPPLYITGKVYDLHGAAVELLGAWLAKLKLEFDFETDGQVFDRSQKRRALEGLAADYRRLARSPGIRLVTGGWPAW